MSWAEPCLPLPGCLLKGESLAGADWFGGRVVAGGHKGIVGGGAVEKSAKRQAADRSSETAARRRPQVGRPVRQADVLARVLQVHLPQALQLAGLVLKILHGQPLQARRVVGR